MEAGAPRAPEERVPEEVTRDEDVQRLHELGYRQELARAWSGFTNFAISFTIISVLAGTFTTFAFAWQNGGPIAASIGWPVLCFFVLMVAFSMAELTSRYPTAGGPYWWAHDLGGKGWSWMTGWFNIVGLVGIVASVGYGAAFFLYNTLALYGVNVLGVNFGDDVHILSETWLLFFLILAVVTALNVFADRFLALLNNVSVGWHVVGVAVVIGLLVFVPDDHQSASFVFGERINNNGAFEGSTSNLGFWLLVLPVGFLLAMYTQTGYDASAHTAEETRGAAKAAAQGVWRSVFWSAVIGWFVLLAFLFAATDEQAVNDAAGFVGSIFTSALDSWAAKMIFLIATIGQLFCVTAGLTSASRTWYAFSRDQAIPGWSIFRRVNRERVPFNAVIAVSACALIIAIPALFGKNDIPFAFFALTGICTVGLYLAYIIPVYLRLRRADRFEVGPWNLGRRYKVVNILAIAFVIAVVYSLNLPYTPTGLPWNDGFDAANVNYTPFAIVLPLIFGVWFLLAAKNRYQGPVRTLEEDVVTRD
ncbi:MAG TPA: amino acid permease [Thermoleophilaceae bacterium]|nr:amino acid permease [Thermoleophilaceae bacterium]